MMKKFFSYGFDSAKAHVLYSFSKQKIPDAFVSTVFKKQYHETIKEKRDNEEISTLFFFLPSITGRKESVDQWRGNVNLIRIDFDIFLIELFSSKKTNFQPNLLNSTNSNERDPQVEMLYSVFKHMAQFSNQNLPRNVNYLKVKEKRNSESMERSVGSSNKRYDLSKFKLTY